MTVGKVAVIGGGSFGTVIANIIAQNGHDVSFWMRSETLAAEVNALHENASYLPGYRLSERVIATHDMAAAVARSDVIFVAVPSSSFRQVVKDLMQYARRDVILVSATKGIEAGPFYLMSQILL